MKEMNKIHLEKAGADEEGVEGLTIAGKHAQEALIGLIVIGNLLYDYYKLPWTPIHMKIIYANFTYL